MIVNHDTLYLLTVAADVVPPEISNCPGAISVEVSSSLSTASVSWDEPTAVDESGIVLTNQNFNPGQLFAVGSTTVTYTFSDQAGNPAICSFVVTVTGNDFSRVCFPKSLHLFP